MRPTTSILCDEAMFLNYEVESKAPHPQKKQAFCITNYVFNSVIPEILLSKEWIHHPQMPLLTKDDQN